MIVNTSTMQKEFRVNTGCWVKCPYCDIITWWFPYWPSY